MNNQQAEEFLDCYRRLEAAAVKVVGTSGKGGPVLRLAQHRDYAKYDDELNLCRLVRNLLSHEAKFDGEFGAYPSAALQGFMKKILQLVESPPKVADKMTPIASLLIAEPQDSALGIMNAMKKRGLSCVPLLKNGRVTGMFGIVTVFQATVNGKPVVNESTTIGDFGPYLPLDAHLGKGFVFVPKDMLISDAKDLFDKAYDRNQRVKLLLVTQTGKADEPLLGLITPYDLLDQD